MISQLNINDLNTNGEIEGSFKSKQFKLKIVRGQGQKYTHRNVTECVMPRKKDFYKIMKYGI